MPADCVGGIPVAVREIPVSAQYDSTVTALAWSADGQRLASIGGFAGQIDIWDRGGQRVQQIKVALGTLEVLAFTHDGHDLVTSRSTSLSAIRLRPIFGTLRRESWSSAFRDLSRVAQGS